MKYKGKVPHLPTEEERQQMIGSLLAERDLELERMSQAEKEPY
jgi:hypothetical protein